LNIDLPYYGLIILPFLSWQGSPTKDISTEDSSSKAEKKKKKKGLKTPSFLKKKKEKKKTGDS